MNLTMLNTRHQFIVIDNLKSISNSKGFHTLALVRYLTVPKLRQLLQAVVFHFLLIQVFPKIYRVKVKRPIVYIEEIMIDGQIIYTDKKS